MIADNETDIVYFSEILKTNNRFSDTRDSILDILRNNKVSCCFLPETRDIWARDYMPIQVSDNTFLEYRYDPDYLQGEENRILKTYPDIVCDSLGLKTIKTDILIDGGNVIKSKDSVILTDKILVENKGIYEPAQLISKLKQLFEVEKVILIPWDEKNDYFGHADGMVRFVDEKCVLVQGYFDLYPKKFRDKLFDALKKANIEWIKLKYDVSSETEYLNWAYINFLQTKDLIIIPKFGIEEDEQALSQISSVFPEYSEKKMIFQVEMGKIVQEGGALNCMSWTIKNKLKV